MTAKKQFLGSFQSTFTQLNMSKARPWMEAHVERIEEQNLDFEALLVGAPNYFCFSNCQNLLAEQGGARSRHNSWWTSERTEPQSTNSINPFIFFPVLFSLEIVWLSFTHLDDKKKRRYLWVGFFSPSVVLYYSTTCEWVQWQCVRWKFCWCCRETS